MNNVRLRGGDSLSAANLEAQRPGCGVYELAFGEPNFLLGRLLHEIWSVDMTIAVIHAATGEEEALGEVDQGAGHIARS
ncbi:MAG: hypothetical protein KKE02_14715 [Alphaproteobacteria bacterium]|nr:hypothetical protein [Alphaproteobacteria bacterium]MBU1513246.1 hypothetical protein [Alphaproteobacteria bacterium]MBU2095354.1 hypothetical protein [Alphaproteobacteria bacterium]MBU2152269.1 hypothetical protein [Alphaproteobacteria bacterium]MBU2306684.1 hypothetical protein [Alphaproteobacteria bacterium]